MAHRHEVHKRSKHRAEGGEVEHEGHPTEVGGNPHVFKIAKEDKAIGHIHGDPAQSRLDRKRGGKAHRAAGGKVGADAHPYTEAHKHGGEVKGHHSLHHGLHGAEKGHKEHHRGR